MHIHYAACPHCDELKAVDVSLSRADDGLMSDSTRYEAWDECACVITLDEERAVIADAEDAHLTAEPPGID